MQDFKASLRKQIKESGGSVRKIAQESGVDYQKLIRWFHGRTTVLDANDAEKVRIHLAKEAEA